MREIQLHFDADTVCAVYGNSDFTEADIHVEGETHMVLMALGLITFTLHKKGIPYGEIKEVIDLTEENESAFESFFSSCMFINELEKARQVGKDDD